MNDEPREKLRPGSTVTLKRVPPGLLDSLPQDDQEAIIQIVGKPIILVEYDEDGRVELEFTAGDGVIHYVFVKPEYIEAV